MRSLEALKKIVKAPVEPLKTNHNETRRVNQTLLELLPVHAWEKINQDGLLLNKQSMSQCERRNTS